MTIVWNIRGTNGSGKTTLARAFLPPDLKGNLEGGPVDLSWYESPTKKEPDRKLRYQGYLRNSDKTLVLGKYEVTCGGMDNAPAGKGFAVPQAAIWHALGKGAPSCFVPVVENIICEGVLASGVYGSWHEFALELRAAGHEFAFVYLHTPPAACLERIWQRQREAGKTPAKFDTPEYDRLVENVNGKWTGTMATRRKAIADGHWVFDLTPGLEERILTHLVAVGPQSFEAEQYRARA